MDDVGHAAFVQPVVAGSGWVRTVPGDSSRGGARRQLSLTVALAATLVTACAEPPATTPRTTLGGDVLERFPAGAPVLERAASVAVQDSTVLVADGMAGSIRRYTLGGDSLPSLGRRGQGPGEFTNLLRIEAGPSGGAWVADMGRQGLVAVDGSGEEVEHVQGPFMPMAAAPLGPERVVFPIVQGPIALGMSYPDGTLHGLLVEGDLTDVMTKAGDMRPVRFVLAATGSDAFYVIDQEDLSVWRVTIVGEEQAEAVRIPPALDIVDPIMDERRQMIRALPGGGNFALLTDAWDADAGGRLILKLPSGPLALLYTPGAGWTALESDVHGRAGLKDLALHGDRLVLLYETEVRIVALPPGLPVPDPSES